MSQQISPHQRGDLDQYRQAIRYCLARTDMDEFFVSLELGGLYELATWQPELMTIYEEETAPKNLTLEPRKTVAIWQATLDGYRSSLNRVYLKHDGKVRKLDVFDRQVLAEANKLPAGTKVEAEVEEHETQSPSGAKYSYLLLNIRPLDRELRSET